MRASPDFCCVELFASDPIPGTPKKEKANEIMQEKKWKKKKRMKQEKEKAQTFSAEVPFSVSPDVNDVQT